MGSDSESQDSDNGNGSRSNLEDSRKIIGPALPPSFGLQEKKTEENSREQEQEEDCFGPALPPHMLNKSSHSSKEITSPKKDDDDIDDTIGPSPMSHENASTSLSSQALDIRAWKLREQFSQKDNADPVEEKREEWMVQLPPVNSQISGLGARKFKSRPGPDMSDRSSWTDTPADKEKKRKELEAGVASKKSNEESSSKKKRVPKIEKEIIQYERNEKSLLQIHQEKLREKRKQEKKEAKETGASTRRPFDRDIDLKINRFSPAQKRSMFSKSREINSKFCAEKR